jgi:uncharacterized protein YdbL (DUF1318 family)
MTEKELLQMQISSFEFYADLIERSSNGTADELPRWNTEKAQQYRQLAEQYRRRLAEIEAAERRAAERQAAGTSGQA